MRNSSVNAFLLPGLITAAILLAATEPARAITYNIVNQGAGIPLTGFITTNNDIGVLQQSDIIAWQITETGTSSPGILATIDNTNSTVNLTGVALSATTTSLVFNFNSAVASTLVFTSNAQVSGNPMFKLTYCDLGAHCTAPFATDVRVNLILNTTSGGTNQSRFTGTSPIAVIAPTPVPGALSLFVGGLGLIGLLARRRKRKKIA
jgi:hypothetical protein